MSAKDRAALRRAKRAYALPDLRTDAQRDDDLPLHLLRRFRR